MKERISAFLKSENKTSAQFAEEIGVQPSGISHILSGRNKPSLDFVVKMLETYPFLSVEWLLFGKGTMYREKTLGELFNISDATSHGNSGTGALPEDAGKTGGKGHEVSLPDQEKDVNAERLKISRIVWFYNDNTFREYFPGDEK